MDKRSVFKQVEEFNNKVIGIDRPFDGLSEAEIEWFIGVLHEEISEYQQAFFPEDRVDALLDLIYFAVGGLTRMGVPAEVSERCFGYVHEANMTKNKGDKRRGDVSFELDAVKPVSWKGPEAKIRKELEEL